MECCIIRKVPYQLPGTKRLVWAVIVAEREGLSLLFVQKPDDKRSHTLAIATENADRIFEDVNVSHFPLLRQDLASIGGKLRALGDSLSEDELKKFFESDDDWNIE